MAQPPQPSGPTVGLATTMVTCPQAPAILPPLPASLPLPTSSPPPLQVRAFWLGMGGALERVASFPFRQSPYVLLLVRGPTSLLPGGLLSFLPFYKINKKISANSGIASFL